MTVYENKHGRRPGRGIRPWLLIPKILSVGALFGGFLSASVMLHTQDPQTREQWTHQIAILSTLFLRLIVPAVICVILFGVLLFLQHPKPFMKMRWLRVKAALLVLTLPPLHLMGRSLINQARQALDAGQLDRVAELMGRFTLTVDLAVLAVIVVIVIGRHKPRLGQRPKPLAEQRLATVSDE